MRIATYSLDALRVWGAVLTGALTLAIITFLVSTWQPRFRRYGRGHRSDGAAVRASGLSEGDVASGP